MVGSGQNILDTPQKTGPWPDSNSENPRLQYKKSDACTPAELSQPLFKEPINVEILHGVGVVRPRQQGGSLRRHFERKKQDGVWKLMSGFRISPAGGSSSRHFEGGKIRWRLNTNDVTCQKADLFDLEPQSNRGISADILK